MRTLTYLIGPLLLVLVLAACSSAPVFTMAGEYGLLLVITESTNAIAPEGTVESGLAVITTTDDDVEMNLETLIFTGTRSGNTATLTYSSGGDTFTMDLTWTSNLEFEGTGRIDYADATYAEMVVDGQSTATPASVGGSDGLSLLN